MHIETRPFILQAFDSFCSHLRTNIFFPKIEVICHFSFAFPIATYYIYIFRTSERQCLSQCVVCHIRAVAFAVTWETSNLSTFRRNSALLAVTLTPEDINIWNENVFYAVPVVQNWVEFLQFFFIMNQQTWSRWIHPGISLVFWIRSRIVLNEVTLPWKFSWQCSITYR